MAHGDCPVKRSKPSNPKHYRKCQTWQSQNGQQFKS